ncbi:hypothetical protein LG3211_3383 [Lysobacter gummosus]|nr:hypothetical protein LG3211_3383 [Lysobacter gummosus]
MAMGQDRQAYRSAQKPATHRSRSIGAIRRSGPALARDRASGIARGEAIGGRNRRAFIPRTGARSALRFTAGWRPGTSTHTQMRATGWPDLS